MEQDNVLGSERERLPSHLRIIVGIPMFLHDARRGVPFHALQDAAAAILAQTEVNPWSETQS